MTTPENTTLIGTADGGRLAIYSEDLSWNYRVLDTKTGKWMVNPDPDFPRFARVNDVFHDLDTGERWALAVSR
jgi:hypothetical protein